MNKLNGQKHNLVIKHFFANSIFFILFIGLSVSIYAQEASIKEKKFSLSFSFSSAYCYRDLKIIHPENDTLKIMQPYMTEPASVHQYVVNYRDTTESGALGYNYSIGFAWRPIQYFELSTGVAFSFHNTKSETMFYSILPRFTPVGTMKGNINVCFLSVPVRLTGFVNKGSFKFGIWAAGVPEVFIKTTTKFTTSYFDGRTENGKSTESDYKKYILSIQTGITFEYNFRFPLRISLGPYYQRNITNAGNFDNDIAEYLWSAGASLKLSYLF